MEEVKSEGAGSDVESDEDDVLNSNAYQDKYTVPDTEEKFLRKFGLNPDDARPTGAQVQKALKYFDLGVKVELTIVSKQLFVSFR